MNIGTRKALGIVTNGKEGNYDRIFERIPLLDLECVYVLDYSPEADKYVFPTYNIEMVEGFGITTIGAAKNRLLERMVADGYDHLFLQEDGVLIKDENVFDAYIETAKQSGIWGGLNYAHHGDANRDHAGVPVLKNHLELDDGLGIDFTHNGTAAFSYIHRRIVETMGYHDEFYQNCWEHLDYYQNLSEHKLGSFWWWFTDIKDSFNYIEELPGEVIRSATWKDDMQAGVEHFREKYGYNPVMMPEATEEQALVRMEYLIDNYSVSGNQ